MNTIPKFALTVVDEMIEGKFIEFCCTTINEIKAAIYYGADRIELCEQLDIGGVTPSLPLIEEAVALSPVPINVLVRCRGGNFVYTEEEIKKMLTSISNVRGTGANAVVIGALKSDGRIDIKAMSGMMEMAKGMSVTFHKAFDETDNPLAAFEELISLGVDRVLTSGHEKSAFEGRRLIADLVKTSDDRITVLAGGKIRKSNINALAEATNAPEYHASISNWLDELQLAYDSANIFSK